MKKILFILLMLCLLNISLYAQETLQITCPPDYASYQDNQTVHHGGLTWIVNRKSVKSKHFMSIKAKAVDGGFEILCSTHITKGTDGHLSAQTFLKGKYTCQDLVRRKGDTLVLNCTKKESPVSCPLTAADFQQEGLTPRAACEKKSGCTYIRAEDGPGKCVPE